MAKRVAGTCYVKFDGQQVDISGGVETPLMLVKRETVMSLTGAAGYKEVAQEQYIKVTAIVRSDFPIALLQSAVEMTVTAELASGKVYVLSNAFIKGEPALKADDGTVDLEFGGLKGYYL